MAKPPLLSRMSRLAAVSADRAMTRASYFAVLVGLIGLTTLSIDPAYGISHGWVQALLRAALAFFIWEWLVRLLATWRTGTLLRYVLSGRGLVDAVAALAVPTALTAGAKPETAWLLGVLWLLKIGAESTGFRLLRRVMVQERSTLLNVAAMFATVLFMASAALHGLEREVQPAAFGTLPSALWWAVVTMTTTGYGDVVPITPLGRVVAAMVMVAGLAVFGLWIGILATGFASEMRRHNFLQTWETVSKVPFFASLGASATADVTNMLRRIDVPRRTLLIRKGAAGDCMYFIADGEVEVELPNGKRIQLETGAFFGEMALFDNKPRSANVTTTRTSTLLVLDVVEFRMLMARHPALAEIIDAEAKRRAQLNT